MALPVTPHDERLPSGERGFSVAFLRALCTLFERHGALRLDMSGVCKKEDLAVNVCRLTASTGLSLIESCVRLARREGVDTSALFGRASTFFSYSWEGSVLSDVGAACERAVTRLEGEGWVARALHLRA